MDQVAHVDVVENLDRLSRQTARAALRTLEDIIDEGITVVTLMDSRQYTAEGIDKDGISLILAILTMMRAHEESATKSRRAKEAFRASVEKARTGQSIVPLKFPGWLKPDATGKKYELIPERVAIVQRIFKLHRRGVGMDSIARTFNREGVPVFADGKRWYGTYILKTLCNRAVLGELHPHEREYRNGKRHIVALKPIKDYYPRIISNKDFDRASALSG